MADVFIGQLFLVPYNFAPQGSAFCDGQLLPISSNTALFSLLGTYYGGDGKSTFGLPNLKGSIPIGQGNGPGLTPRTIGETGGVTTVTLTAAQTPQHSHLVLENSIPVPPPVGQPSGNSPGQPSAASATKVYFAGAPNVQMFANALTPAQGGSGPHNNLMPTHVLNWVIALQGVFPPRG